LTTVSITHVGVVDVAEGRVEPETTVVVREGRIAVVEPQGSPDETGDVVDGSGKFLIPGLFDMHVHLSWTTASALPVLVANGVTSVRDMGGRLAELDAWRARIEAGLVTGPRLWRAGPMLNGKSFNEFQLVVGSASESRGVVRVLKHVGVDFVKTHRQTSRDAYFALLDEAREQGLPLVGHIPMEVKPEEASDAGQYTVEHTETLFEGTFSAAVGDQPWPPALRRFRAEEGERLFARFVENGTVVTPTLVPWASVLEAAGELSPDSAYVAASLKESAPPRMSDPDLAEWEELFPEFLEVVRQMHRAGVTLLAGTDIASTRIPGFTLHRELELLVEAGLTPVEALRAATVNGARALDADDDLGTVEPGKLADLVLLGGNPLDDIRNTQRIEAVVVRGRLLGRKDLDGLLEEGERLASRN
jgi:imidazolonepropionase-like amidohydrolase